MANAIAKIGAYLTFDDGCVVAVNEDDTVTGLVYVQGKNEVTIESGRVRVICGRTVLNNSGPSDCPPNPYLHKFITPTQLIIDHSDDHKAKVTRVDVNNIVSIGKVTSPEDVVEEGTVVVGSGPAYKSLTDILAEVEEGTTLKLLAGEYSEPLKIDKSVQLVGDGDAVFTAPITVDLGTAKAAGASTLLLDGISLSGKASLNIKNVAEVVIQNCVIGGYDFEARTNPIIFGETPVHLTIENNLFTENAATVYNLIECSGILQDGSSISFNKFETGDCAHNSINLYNAADDAHINMEGNLFAYCVNVMRIGFKGNVQNVMLNLIDNVVEGITPGTQWAGMFCLQPFSTKTTSMAGLTVNMENNQIDREYVCYLYAAPKDTQWTASNKPTVLLDGKKFTIPDISAQVNGQ